MNMGGGYEQCYTEIVRINYDSVKVTQYLTAPEHPANPGF